MRGITLHLNDIVEEREREERKRRKPKAAVFAMVMAAAGFLAGQRMTTPAEVRIVVNAPPVTWPAFEPIAVDVVPAGPNVPEPRGTSTGELLTISRRLFDVAGAESAIAPEPHLCISPNRIVWGGQASDRLTISNPGTAAVAITDVGTTSGYEIDPAACRQKILWPGQHCTMTVSRIGTTGDAGQLWIYNDAGEPVPFNVDS